MQQALAKERTGNLWGLNSTPVPQPAHHCILLLLSGTFPHLQTKHLLTPSTLDGQIQILLRCFHWCAKSNQNVILQNTKRLMSALKQCNFSYKQLNNIFLWSSVDIKGLVDFKSFLIPLNYALVIAQSGIRSCLLAEQCPYRLKGSILHHPCP